MTTDTASVDALRTRLARAFEVAALRDPSAELAAFEAAVRHDQGERIAKDHDEQADEYERLGYLGEDIYRACARRARGLSPPP